MAMTASASPQLRARFLATAKESVSRSLQLLGKADGVRALAGELHRMGGEAAMVGLPEVAQVAWDGEKAAALLGANANQAARVPCGRLLRKLGYLLQELSDRHATPVLADPPARTSGGCRVLIVDDSLVAAQALADVFELRGFEVRTATSLEIAMQTCAAFSPAVLVADVQMPNLDVAELCLRFREGAKAQRSAILLISGRSEAELRDRLDAIRPEAFVSKLAGADVVVSRVATLFEEHET
jgi:CheY-like chemotaxis protein/HPt (histidine-containing phosphotransfer) domain-containing protein